MWSKTSQLRKRRRGDWYAEHNVVAVAHEDMRDGLITPCNRHDSEPSTKQRMPAVNDFKPVAASVVRVVGRGIKRWCRSIALIMSGCSSSSSNG